MHTGPDIDWTQWQVAGAAVMLAALLVAVTVWAIKELRQKNGNGNAGPSRTEQCVASGDVKGALEQIAGDVRAIALHQGHQDEKLGDLKTLLEARRKAEIKVFERLDDHGQRLARVEERTAARRG